ncbi:MAG: patatin-like phospholipase family protein [Candidatus Acidiferrales bacterium]
MDWARKALKAVRRFAARRAISLISPPPTPRVGLALGGGFARGISHIGVLRAFEKAGIRVDCIAGVSVGALIATAYAAGASLAEMEKLGAATQFKDFGRWTLSWLGLASNQRLEAYLRRICPAKSFDELKIPLSIVATDLGTGDPVEFSRGEVCSPLRASCAYPGLFLPVQHEGRLLVDGFLAAPVPVDAVRRLGADFVVAVYLDSSPPDVKPTSMFDVIGRSFAIMQRHANSSWQRRADVVITPDVAHFAWDDFRATPQLIAAGEAAAEAVLPKILAVLKPNTTPSAAPAMAPVPLQPILPAPTSTSTAD